jgi:hypothetical protein
MATFKNPGRLCNALRRALAHTRIDGGGAVSEDRLG